MCPRCRPEDRIRHISIGIEERALGGAAQYVTAFDNGDIVFFCEIQGIGAQNGEPCASGNDRSSLSVWLIVNIEDAANPEGFDELQIACWGCRGGEDGTVISHNVVATSDGEQLHGSTFRLAWAHLDELR